MNKLKTSTVDLALTFIAGVMFGLLLALMWRAVQITRQYDREKAEITEMLRKPSGISPDNQ
jgi:hypothetical protein